MASSLDQLSAQRQVFVREYVVDFDTKRALKEAGYKAKNTGVAGAKLLGSVEVQKAIRELLTPMAEEAELTTARVLKQLQNFLFYDITPYVDQAGFLKCKPEELPESVRQCIAGMKGHRSYTKDGDVAEERIELKMVSKDASLKLAMQYLKLLEPDLKLQLTQNVFSLNDLYTQLKQPLPPPVEAVIEGKIVEGKMKAKEARNGKKT